MSMRYAVTGGAGFIGSHIVDGLLERGAEVMAIDDLSGGRRENLSHAIATKRLELVIDDIQGEKTEKAFKSFKPEVVFHLAAQMNVRHSVKDPVFDTSVNVLGTVRLLQHSLENGLKKFIFSSTGGAIYGEQETFPATEDHRTQAESPYGVSKRAGELYLDYFARKCGLTTVALRYGNVYGPRQNSKGEAGVVSIFCERAIAREKLLVNGDGLQTRDYVYVSDVVKANMAALDGKLEGFSIFNVGTGIEHTVLDIVTELTEITKPNFKLEYEHGPALPGEQKRSVIDHSKISRVLGWNPVVNFHDGIKATFESFCASN